MDLNVSSTRHVGHLFVKQSGQCNANYFGVPYLSRTLPLSRANLGYLEVGHVKTREKHRSRYFNDLVLNTLRRTYL